MENITGLRYIEDIMTEEKERKLIEYIDNKEWDNTLKRRTQQYGHRYNYNHVNNINNNVNPVPKKFLRLFKKLRDLNIGSDIDVNKLQVIVNEYQPGQGISAHVDDPQKFGEWIISVSLGGNCIVKFTKNNESRDIYIKKRSVYEMKSDARYKYKHQIENLKSDIINENKINRERRISITFRYIK
jgi:alkylated DNA repair dioxygenase AlkB